MSTVVLIFLRLATIDAPPTDHSPARSTPTATIQLAQFESPIEQPARQPTEQELQEIMQIRRQTSPLRSTLLDDSEFASQLKRDFGGAATTTGGDPTNRGPVDDRSLSEADKYRRRSIRSLRRRMQSIAQDLDELGLRSDASRMRTFATELGESGASDAETR